MTAVIGVGVAVWFGQWREGRPDKVIADQYRSRVVVTMVDGETFAGMLDSADKTHIRLLDAEGALPGKDPQKVDGALILPRGRVSYWQIP